MQIEVNPIIRKANPSRNIPIVKPHEIDEWLIRQAQNNGFKINNRTFQKPKPISVVQRPSNRIKITSVQLDTVVEVTDQELFKNFLKNGIGKTKAYGFGMPLIAKI